jgi:hypothetical protein
MIKFNYGVKFKNILYGWHNKKLYRLPYINKNYNFPLKELSLISIGNKYGYRLSGKKKTINQLKELTNLINFTYIDYSNNEDLPF